MRRSARERGRIRIPAQSALRSRVSTSPVQPTRASSSSPQTISRSIRSPTSVRRSDRIAQIQNGQSNSQFSNATSTMTDVARPRSLGSRTVRARHRSEENHTLGQSRSAHHFLSPENIRYAMDIVVQPPRTARAGQSMAGSIVVRLRTTNADPSDAVACSFNLVGVVTLISETRSPTLIDPNLLNAALVGRRLDSIHPFADDEADGSIASMDMADPNGVGYMSFPELIIRRPGTYRIRITLIRIHPSSSEPRVESAGNGSSMQIVDSTPIFISGNEASSNSGPPNDM